MNVLFVGTGSGGSWEIRGKQIGRALGARVTSHPSDNDWAWADLIVLVKHAAERFTHEAAQTGASLIWDVLDWWKQPEHNDWPISEVIGDVEMVREALPDVTLIAATQTMADAIGGMYIPHHYRPCSLIAPVRDRVEVIAYEGTAKYLGSWKKHLEAQANAIGAAFIVNPTSLSDADLVVAFRGEKWDGPICRQWKSGVKIANAIAVGRPILTQPSAAFVELSPTGSAFDDPMYLDGSIEEWLDPVVRQETANRAHAQRQAFTLAAVAQQYRHLFDQVMRRAA